MNHALFWLSLEEARRLEPTTEVLRLWRWGHVQDRYWRITEADQGWLTAEAVAGTDPEHRRVAFDVLCDLAELSSSPTRRLAALERRFASDPLLMADLTARSARPAASAEATAYQKEAAARASAQAEAEAIRLEEWRALAKAIKADPSPLTNEARFDKWPGPKPLLALTRWLAQRLQEHDLSRAALSYHDLGKAFPAKVVAAYAQGMKRFWRVTEPRAPKFLADGRKSVPCWITLSMAGLALDSADTPGWADSLTLVEARRAIDHLFRSDEGIQDRIYAKLVRITEVAEPPVIRAIRREWPASLGAYKPFLYRVQSGLPLTPGLQRAILRLVEGPEPSETAGVDAALQVTRRLVPTLQSAARWSLLRQMERRFMARLAADEWDTSVIYVAIVFALDGARGRGRSSACWPPSPQRCCRSALKGQSGPCSG